MWLKTSIVGAVNDVSNRWDIDSIFNHRESFELEIGAEANKRIKQWFLVSQLRTNIVPPNALIDQINKKTQAMQEVQTSMNRKLAAEADAQRKIALARGDSADLVIRAKADAEAIRLKQQEITPNYINYIIAQTWKGDMPSTLVTSGSNGLIFNLGKTQ